MAGSTWPTLTANAKAKASEVEAKFDWVEQDIVPMTGGTKTDATYDLGTSSFRWRDLWLSRAVFAANSLNVRQTATVTNYLVNAAESSSGNTLTMYLANTSNSANSQARIFVSVAGATAGDSFIHLTTTVTDWSFGIDNSDSDKFKFSRSGVLGTTDLVTIDIDGNLGVGTSSPSAKVQGNGTTAASTVSVAVTHADNIDSGSHARFYAQVGGASGGDPFTRYDTQVNSFSIGIDNSDSDKFKVSQSVVLGANDALVITTAGEVTLPLQPAFLAYNSAQDTNQTGAGTVATVDFDTEVFDQGSDFSADTFTAPVTGRYLLTVTVKWSDANFAAKTAGEIRITTSNRTYRKNYPHTAVNGQSPTLTVIADMDAADTATANLRVQGGADDVAIDGPTDILTHFSGCLLA